MVGRWHDRLAKPLELLQARVTDVDPLVRLEAVIACAAIPDARSIEIAALVVDYKMDSWIEYAFEASYATTVF